MHEKEFCFYFIKLSWKEFKWKNYMNHNFVDFAIKT